MPFDTLDHAIRTQQGLSRGGRVKVKRRAAVALVFHGTQRGILPDLLMIRRADAPGDPWSGHMAFPGGKQDPEDDDSFATALRETREELNLDLSGARRLGALHPIVSPKLGRPRIAVDPYAFGLGRPQDLRPNQEVASVHWFGVQRLLEGEGRATFPFTWQGQPVQLPCVRLDGCFIWGMSLAIIDDLLARLRGSGGYIP